MIEDAVASDTMTCSGICREVLEVIAEHPITGDVHQFTETNPIRTEIGSSRSEESRQAVSRDPRRLFLTHPCDIDRENDASAGCVRRSSATTRQESRKRVRRCLA